MSESPEPVLPGGTPPPSRPPSRPPAHPAQPSTARPSPARASHPRNRPPAPRRRDALALAGSLAGVIALVLAVVVVIVTVGTVDALSADVHGLTDDVQALGDRVEDLQAATAGDDAAPESRSPLTGIDGPRGSTPAGAIPIGPEGIAGTTAGAAPDAVVVSVYSDYICPFCRHFDDINGAALAELREAGVIVVEYHLLSILDDASQGTAYSTRAAAAAALVADRAPEAFLGLNAALFADQPEEGTTGLTNAQIADLARTAGAPEDVAQAIRSGQYLQGPDSLVTWVAAATAQAALDLDRLATPTIWIDGRPLDRTRYDWTRAGQLAQAIADARG